MVILRRIQITGFKSFSAKTTLELEPGVTAIVGPNGSGKSNLADAVRWVLGEQNKGKLRLQDRDEVIFAGTTDKPRASYAEVVLILDNTSGVLPVDLAEVAISRRLYRSGESEYRVAGKTARLADITEMLVHAGVSPTTYTVIGQGMIDSFLLSSPAERKLLFDEAAGIRGPELGREAALRKLAATQGNLTRLRDIAAELQPRLAALEKVVGAADEQLELEQRIAGLRAEIVAARFAQSRQQAAAAQAGLAATTARLAELEQAQDDLAAQLKALQANRAAAVARSAELERQVEELETERSQLSERLLALQAEHTEAKIAAESSALKYARADQIRQQLESAGVRLEELEAELTANAAVAERAATALERATVAVVRAQKSLVALRTNQSDGSRDQYLGHALEILKVLAAGLNADRLSGDRVKLLVHKAGRLLSHAARRGASELVAELQTAQAELEAAMAKRETAAEHQTNITITRRSLEIDLEYQRDVLRRLQDEQATLAAASQTAGEATARADQLGAELERVQERLTELQTAITEARHRVTAQRPAADVQRESQLAVELERAATAHRAAQAAGLGHQVELKAAAEAEAAARELAASWSVEPPSPTSGASAPAPGPAVPDLADLATRLAAAEASYAAKTSARADQVEEYQAVSARHNELAAQIADLETAQADLQEVITRLDELIRSRFKANFRALSDQFSAYFERLFNGGSAKLSLVESTDGSYGIEMKASPKGKRLTALASLSGGERALTGVALLAAILRVNPSPFVVLDEIDAALDEANSGRLSGILGELAERSQLIVITHNRQTMQAAQVLFGVTLNDQHVSTVLSVRLAEAEALAAR